MQAYKCTYLLSFLKQFNSFTFLLISEVSPRVVNYLFFDLVNVSEDFFLEFTSY